MTRRPLGAYPGPPQRFSPRVYGVLVREGRVLLTRSVFMGREFVNFPGGGVELGEPPIAALRREFLEETGLRIKTLDVLYASREVHLSTQVPMQIVSMYWRVESLGGRLKTEGNQDDVLGLFWAPLDAIPTRGMFPADLEFANYLKNSRSPRGRDRGPSRGRRRLSPRSSKR